MYDEATIKFTKLFYCERANIAHIQSGDNYNLAMQGSVMLCVI